MWLRKSNINGVNLIRVHYIHVVQLTYANKNIWGEKSNRVYEYFQLPPSTECSPV
jgi:hypothetical protein